MADLFLEDVLHRAQDPVTCSQSGSCRGKMKPDMSVLFQMLPATLEIQSLLLSLVGDQLLNYLLYTISTNI